MLGLLLLVSSRATAPRWTGEPADHARRRPRARPARRAHRGDDVLADVGAAGPRRAPGQRDPAGGPVRDQAGADPVAVARASRATGSGAWAAGPSTSVATRRDGSPRTSSDTRPQAAPAPASSGRSTRLLTGSVAEPLLARRPVARQAERQADHRRHRGHDAGRERPAHRARRARQQLRRGRRPRSTNGPRPRDGLVAELQPERRRGALRPRSSGSAPTASRRRRSSTAPARGSTRRDRRSRS